MGSGEFGISQLGISKLTELSKLVENITGVNMAVNKPIIGENAFTHGSGIHQHGVFMNPITYESFHPKLIGRRRRVYIDELCGTHGVLYIAERELGMNISKDTAQKVLSRIKTSYSHGARRSAYTPSELKRLIVEVKGASQRNQQFLKQNTIKVSSEKTVKNSRWITLSVK